MNSKFESIGASPGILINSSISHHTDLKCDNGEFSISQNSNDNRKKNDDSHSYLKNLDSVYNLDSLLQLTDINSQAYLQNMIKNSSTVVNKKNNSISDSSTADSDSSYMDDRYESESEFFPCLIDKAPVDEDVAKLTRKKIVSGYAGQAKNNSLPIFTNLSEKCITLNYGDDVGFICNKNLNETEFIVQDALVNNDLDRSSNLVNKYYFGLADGVSANRLRGYDAKLFPNALINACVEYCDKSAEYYTNYAIKYKSVLMNERIKSQEDELDSNIEHVVSVLKDYKINRYSEHEDEYEEYDEIEEEDENEDDYEEYEYDTYAEDDEKDSLEIEENDCDKLKSILSKAHESAEEKQVYGSSTVCLVSLEFYDTTEYSLLSSCNVGDSGYMVIRDKKVLFKSQSQSHRYNAPYQLGCTPPELEEHHLYRDKAEDSICHSHLVKSGDFLLISSDGMFDNLYEDEIALVIDQSINSFEFADSSSEITSELLSSICQIIVQRASKAGIKQDDMLVMLIYIN